MDRDRLVFTGHAIRQMFARQISGDDVQFVVNDGATIAAYLDDNLYPSRLILGFVNKRHIHVVFAYNSSEQAGYVITVYEPNPKLWEGDFRTRRSTP